MKINPIIAVDLQMTADCRLTSFVKVGAHFYYVACAQRRSHARASKPVNNDWVKPTRRWPKISSEISGSFDNSAASRSLRHCVYNFHWIRIIYCKIQTQNKRQAMLLHCSPHVIKYISVRKREEPVKYVAALHCPFCSQFVDCNGPNIWRANRYDTMFA